MGDISVGPKPSKAAPVPGFPQISVKVWLTGQRLITFAYYGWPEDLIAAGILTQQMLEATRGHRRDADGFPVTIDRYWGVRDGEPVRRFKLLRSAPVESMNRLPGALAAIEAAERYEEWHRAFYGYPLSNQADSAQEACLHSAVSSTLH